MAAPLAPHPGGNPTPAARIGAGTGAAPVGLFRAHPVVLVAALGAVGLVGWYLWKRHAKGGRSARRRSSHPLTRRVKRAPAARRVGRPLWIG